MTTLRLALRLLAGGGRAGAARLVMMVLGIAVGVAAIGLVTALPGVLNQRELVMAARIPADGESTRFSCAILSDSWQGRPLNRVFVTDISPGATPPPGLSRWPDPGEYMLSPALRAAAAEDSQLAVFLPGRDAGTIGPAGLIGPSEFYVYIAVPADQLPTAGGAAGFGGLSGTMLLDEQQAGLPQALAALVLPPVILYLTVCSRLASAARNRRFAALRLIGLRRRGVLAVGAVESTVAGIGGGILGIALLRLVTPSIATSSIVGFTWYPQDSWPVGTYVAATVGVAALAALIGALGLRRSLDQPLQARNELVDPQTRPWQVLPLAGGLSLIGGSLLLGAAAEATQSTAWPIATDWLALAGIALASVGLLTGLRPVIQAAGRWVATERMPLPIRLAGRRLTLESSSTLRMLAGLLIMVVVAGVGSGLMLDVEARAQPVLAERIVRLSADQVSTPAKLAAIDRSSTRASWTDQGNVNPDGEQRTIFVSLISITCADLLTVAGSVEGRCEDGRLYYGAATEERDSPYLLETGTEVTFRTAKNAEVQVPVPAERLFLPLSSPLHGGESGVLLWTGDQPRLGWTTDTSLEVLIPGDPDALSALRRSIYAVAPAAQVQVDDDHPEMAETSRGREGILHFGTFVGYLLGSAAFAIAAVDRALDRRRTITSLRVLGMSRGELRATQLAQLLLPLAAGLLAATVVALLGGFAVYRFNDLSRPFPPGIVRALLPLVGLSVISALVAGLVVAGTKLVSEDLHRE